MKVAIAQIKYKTADLKYNYENIIKHIHKEADLIIFPRISDDDFGGNDLLLDENYYKAQYNLYKDLAKNNFKQTILIGDVLIRNGKIDFVNDDFFELCGEKIFVSDSFIEDVKCDLYILAKNRYYAINTYQNFVENINSQCNFVFISAVGLNDENVFCGMSFAKNSNNELVMQMPLCKEELRIIDFSDKFKGSQISLEEEIVTVTTFALKEYCENTGFKKVILGLSGGIDSALTAALSVKALGKDNVIGILMPSMFSSEGSITDSLELAEILDIKTIKEPITDMFKNFMNNRENLGDLAEENLQARIRGLILMFYSNRYGYLLLSTGNKSESAMGFGTLYGDLAGGYNLICDLTKTNVYKVSNYLNKDKIIIPKQIIDKAPSAELHPNQKDQDRLPAYEILDDIIEMYFENNISMDKISEKYNKKIVEDVIRKIYRMQFKRYQCCLGVRLTERSFIRGAKLPVIQNFY